MKAPYFQGTKLLISADCTAYAYANFHQEFMRGKVTIVGYPKLDPVNYSEKLTEIGRQYNQTHGDMPFSSLRLLVERTRLCYNMRPKSK